MILIKGLVFSDIMIIRAANIHKNKQHTVI